MQQGALRRNGMSSSEYTQRAQTGISQKCLLEERKRMNGLIENMNYQDWKEKKIWNKWRKKGGRNLWENTKQLEKYM